MTDVACPLCGARTAVPAAETGEPRARRSVALFGEHVVATCPAGDAFPVYYC